MTIFIKTCAIAAAATGLALSLILVSPVAAEVRGNGIIYVDQSATDGTNDGTSWDDAFLELFDAIDQAQSGDEIWVAAGLYTPADASSSFGLLAGVRLYGGFAGDESKLDDREWVANQTILSGDVDGDDEALIANSPTDIVGDNASRIVNINTAGPGTRIDGFTITAADGGGDGGGMRIANGDGMVVANVNLVGNFTDSRGGGIFVTNASPELRSVNFMFNRSERGGGIRIDGSNSQPTLIDVTFQENSSTNNGGALYSTGNGFRAVNVRFLANESDQGGAITCNNCTIDLVNGLFVGNKGARGGMLQNVEGGEVSLTHVTAWGNLSNDGPGAIDQFQAEVTINNSIFWGHGAGSPINDFNMNDHASHSLVENLAGGTNGNLDGTESANEPKVIRLPDLNNDNYGNLRMQEDSPTIGQGDNDLLPPDEFDLDGDGNTSEPLPVDLDSNARIVDGTVDLGPYEFFLSYTVTASVVSGNGSITPQEQVVAEGEAASFTVTSDPDWEVDEVTGDTCNPELVDGSTWEAVNIQEDCSVQASFTVPAELDDIFDDRFETTDG